MDANLKKCCPCCNQFYQLKTLCGQKHGNIPLLLSCGHSICENCVTNIVKFSEPIECKVCHKDTEIDATSLTSLTQNKISIYQLFPVNLNLLGELTLQAFQVQDTKKGDEEKNLYVDIKAIIENDTHTAGICVECNGPTTKTCQLCGIIICNLCFDKSHKNYNIFKNHVLKNIETTQEQSTCVTHLGKYLEYYCNDCNKAACMDCLMVGGDKSCKNHNVVLLQEMNKSILAEITEKIPELEEKLKRLTKTAVDIGNILTNLENDGNSSVILTLSNNVEQHFSRLQAFIQKQKENVVQKLIKLKTDEKNSLFESKFYVTEGIKKAKHIIDSVSSINDTKLRQMNLSVFLEEAEEIINMPWYISRDTCEDVIKLKVNDDVISSLQDFIQVEEEGNLVYELLSTKELNEKNIDVPPPPQTIVYPPQIITDVRLVKKQAEKDNTKKPTLIKSVPQYRSKTGSTSSLASNTSDSSHQGYIRNTQYDYSYLYNQNKQINQRSNKQSVFPEIIQQKPLREGDQDLVYISHIVDPHNFYVQRACHQTIVEELLREFRNANTIPKPSLNHITAGKIYLVFIKADNLWQRCRVLSINRKDVNKPTIKVYCFDFGSTETVHIDKLRLIPSSRIQTPPPLAINCSLDNCQPINGAWTSDDAMLIQNIIDNKQAVLMVRAVTNSENGIRISCELATYEHGVSVAHALAFHGRAHLVNNAPYPKILGIKESPKIFTSNDFKPDSKEDVYITYIVSPDKFFVRKRHIQAVYEKLCEELSQEYNSNDNTGIIYLPEKNMACAVNVERCSEGQASTCWVRGRVVETPGRAHVRVLLVDTGEEPLVHWTALRRLQYKFCTLRALATECHLAGVTPLNKKWTPASVKLLSTFMDRVLHLHVEHERSRGSVGITLYDEQPDEDVVCVNTLMIQRKFAVSFGLFMFNTDSITKDLVRTNKSPLEQPKPAKVAKNRVKILKKGAKIDMKHNENNLDAKDKGPIRLEVNILNYQSPSLLYVSMVHQQKTFTELFDKIQTYYTKKNTTSKGDWKVGDRCCTICNLSQTWRRAAILEINGDYAKVFYSDFALVETVPIANLREIHGDFTKVGDAAIMCHLSGVVPAVGEDWPSLTKEYLKELLDAYQRIFVTKIGKFKDKSMPVELWVYHTIQGGALEPNTSEWRCLNKKIIEQGLGIPDKTLQSTDTTDNTNGETISFLNITGSIEDWLQIEPMPLKPLTVESDVESNTQPSTPTELDTEKPSDAAQDSNTLLISDWLPAEPLPTKEFTAVPTYIDNDGVIYLHHVDQQETLDLIRKALDVRFKHPDPKAKYVKWTVGEPCVALYFLDSKFYRGRVMEVDEEKSSCLIHYIDYGNEEICPFVNLRKSIALYQIPIQTQKCILHRIRPIGKQWDRVTLDYIHKSVVEKECYAEVAGDPIGDVIPINLKFNKLWINEHLVEFEMATFIDGTKPMKQKFVPNIKKNETTHSQVESDSDPDYIVEQSDNTLDSPVPFDMQQFKNRDWNEILDEEEKQLGSKKFVSFPKIDITEFTCDINFINDVDKLELSIKYDDTVALKYENMFEKLQECSSDLTPLDGVFADKACIALFPEDNKWYRASILQYSEAKGRVKVKYVDYGNIHVVPLSDIREISEEFVQLPPVTITACLYGVEINPNASKETILERYSDELLDQGPFIAKVIRYKNSIPCVELIDENGDIPYESLFDDIFIRSN